MDHKEVIDKVLKSMGIQKDSLKHMWPYEGQDGKKYLVSLYTKDLIEFLEDKLAWPEELYRSEDNKVCPVDPAEAALCDSCQ
jgi:hypothetical protein